MTGLDDLRKALLSERETGKLLQIAPDFFERTNTALRTIRKNVADCEDPFSDEVQKMILETRSIEQTRSDLLAIRAGKILSLAESHAQGQYTDREEVRRMIAAEREMFDRTVDAIRSCMDTLVQGTASTPVQEKTEVPVPAVQEGESADTAMPSPQARPASLPEESRPAYALVRVLADMDAFMGVDGMTYDLTKGDIVMLPERNAEVLVDRNIALNMNVGK
jgi:DNA replication factor GINS